jgi:hypothetical protein
VGGGRGGGGRERAMVSWEGERRGACVRTMQSLVHALGVHAPHLQRRYQDPEPGWGRHGQVGRQLKPEVCHVALGTAACPQNVAVAASSHVHHTPGCLLAIEGMVRSPRQGNAACGALATGPRAHMVGTTRGGGHGSRAQAPNLKGNLLQQQLLLNGFGALRGGSNQLQRNQRSHPDRATASAHRVM